MGAQISIKNNQINSSDSGVIAHDFSQVSF